ncbi:MAG: beta-N-acetylhexosaminidase [Pseudomonadota bacterium]
MALGSIMLDIEGLELTPLDRDLLRQPAVGGVILFKRNFSNITQITELIADIKSVKTPALLVGVDQEGGRVQRFGAPMTALPPMGWFGLLFDRDARAARELARETGWLLAAELLQTGVDVSFAPVLDLQRGVSSVIGDRAFHRSVDGVVALASAMMHGMQEAGMPAVGKHFPGHGAVVADSHLELPVDRREYADITEDIQVFERMILAGIPALMSAHVVYATLDPLPASFSPWWLTSELRTRLGFRGAVFSDDLTMRATSGFGDITSRSDAVLAAGTDMILICNDRSSAEAAVDHQAGQQRPEAMARLARMRATPTFDVTALNDNPRWRSAREQLQSALAGELVQ